MQLPRRRTLQRLVRRAELIARLAETWVRRPSSPNRLILDVTRRCNLRCQMCRTWQREADGELSAAEIGDLLHQLPRLCWLDVTGGEPFLRADAAELFRAIADATPALHVLHFPTNGWFTRRIAEVAADWVKRRPEVQLIVTVSIDGPREVHDRVRGVPGAFDRALDTFRMLRAMDGVDVYVGTTISEHTRGTVAALSDVLTREVPGFRGSEWHWNRLQVSEHFFNNGGLAGEQPPGEDLVREHLARRGAPRSLVDLMELAFLVNLEFVQDGEPSGITCQSLRSTAFVSPEGDVYPCHVYDRPVGNVLRRPFSEIWHDRATLRARADIEALACGGCFTPCEAYPALAGAPLQTAIQTSSRALRLVTTR